MKTNLFVHTGAKVQQNDESSPFLKSFSDLRIPDEETKLVLDVFETAQDLVFIIPVAGVEIQKLQVFINDDVLTVSGERPFPEDIFSDEYATFLEECHWGPFSRSITLPADINSEHAVAKLKNGILMVQIPKAHKAQSKRIPVELVDSYTAKK